MWAQWASALKKNTYALYLASRHPKVSALAKIMIVMVLAYALSPIDLIPDFIPVIGYLDDILLLPIGIWLAIRLIPQNIWLECQKAAQEQTRELPKNRLAAAIIIIIWLLLVVGFMVWLLPLMAGVNGTW